MKLATLIVHFNLSEDTLKCVASLRRQTDGPIVLVDNGSKKSELERLSEGIKNDQQIFLLRNETNEGFCAGVNRAYVHLKQLGAELTDVLILNPDVELGLEFVAALAEARRQHPTDILGGAMYSQDARPLFQGSLAPGLFFLRGRLKLQNEPYPVAFAEGSALLIAKDLAERRFNLFGYLFDPRLFIYWEDCDLCLWAKSVGHTTRIVPRARAVHDFSKTTGRKSPFKTYYMTRNFIFIARRYLNGALDFAFPFYFSARTLVDILVRDVFRPKRATARWRGLRDGFRGTLGERGDYRL